MKQRKKRGRLSPVAENNLSDLFSGMTYAPAGTYGMGQAASLTVVRRSMLSSATTINGSLHFLTVNFSYVMKNKETMMMAKRLLGMMFAVVLSIFVTKAQDLVYDGITPAPGSEISSFDFVLKFDLSKVIEANGPGDYGVGWTGYHNDKRPEREKSVTIYKGEPSDGVVIGRVCSSNYNGGTTGFVPSSDIFVKIDGAIPEPGVKYTMVINNEFKVFSVGNAVPIANALFDCYTTPISYTFVGTEVSAEKLNIASCSVTANQSIDVLNEVKFTFSRPVSINSGNPLVVKENDAVYATSAEAVLSEDKTEVTYMFDNAFLLNGHSYVISLPAGAVTSVNSSETNAAFNIIVSGTYVGYFNLKSSIPTSEQKTLFQTVEGIFDMPTGMQIYKGSGSSLNLDCTLYKGSIAEENLVGILKGESNSTNNGIVWTNTFALDPSSTYILFIPSRQFRARDISSGKLSDDWYNDEVNIVLNTPSKADADIPPFVFQNPVNGQYEKTNTVLEPNSKVDYIGTFELALKDLNYQYEGKNYEVSINSGAQVLVYDITDGKESLVRTATISTRGVEPEDWHLPNYNAWGAGINTHFFEGHKYKLVIPAGVLSINYILLKHYATNEEWSLELEGSTPTKVELTACSLKDNDELSELASIKWTFKGGFVQNTNEYIGLKYKNKSGGGLTLICPTVVSNYGSFTEVFAYLPATNTGEAYQFVTDREYQIIFPEGFIYYEGDPSIKNSEMVYNIIPVAKTPDVVEPEFVDVKIVTNDFMTTIQKAVKGKQFSYSMSFNSTDEEAPVCWEVKSVTPADMVLALLKGAIRTKPLNDATTLNIEVEYTGDWATNISSNVWEIKNDNPIQIFEEGGMIVIQGVTPENTICVYNVAGMLVNTTRTTEGNDIVRLSVSNGQTYIVTVDGIAAKIYVK